MPLFRILMDPAEDGGGASAAEDVVTIARAELDELRARAAEGSRADLEQELDASRRRAADWERAYRGALRDRELAAGLAGRPLVAGGAAQLVKLWRDEFDVFEDGGELRVASRDGRTVDQVVAERLAGPDYAHFCPPASRGGTAAPGPSARRPVAPPTAPARTLGEAVIQQWRETVAAGVEATGLMGLRRR